MRSHAAIVALLVATGCTRSYGVGTLQPATRVEVRTTDQAVRSATVAAHPTEVVLVDDAGRTIRPRHIARVSRTNHKRGALDGAAAGAIAGIVIGAAIGAAAGSDPCSDPMICIMPLSAYDKAVLAGGTLGLLGAATGALIGAVIGSTDVYTFGVDHELGLRLGGPAGSIAGATIQF